MTARHAPPPHLEALEWDVAVIGTGMGGATAGYALARLGRRVLFIEKGRVLPEPAAEGDSPAARLSRGLWPERLEASTTFGETEFFAPLGCGTGGSTLLYAAALERFAPSDFAPRANHPAATTSSLPERWPVAYEEMRPFYEAAERLFRVSGTPDPLDRGGDAPLRPPPVLSPRDAHFEASFRARGLHPYRVHVGCEFVDGCTGCAAGPCQQGCKSDAARICLVPALEQYGASLLAGCEVRRIEASRSAVTSLLCERDGQPLVIRAKVVILAAGAYMTPRLLLASASPEWPDGLANRSGLVGRNLMLHVSDFFALAPLERLPAGGPQKCLAFNDFYDGEHGKLGTFQTAGMAIGLGQVMQYMREAAERDPAWWRRLASPRPAWWRRLSSPAVRLAALGAYHALGLKYASVWATIVEDLPYTENRVAADPAARNGMRIVYGYPAELRRRVLIFRERLAQALHPHRLIRISGENNLNFGHACGTCRFGDDPRSSVLDRDNRAHGLDNLFVLDASFFPSSGGTNPSLTIAANALRAAPAVHAALG